MGKIYGDLRYLKSYGSASELQRDPDVRQDTLVYVAGEDTVRAYAVRDFNNGHQGSFKLSGSNLYANALTQEDILDFRYTSPAPVPADVGGVPEGFEFYNATYEDVFNRLFYPEAEVDFSITTNFNGNIFYKGTQQRLESVEVYAIRATYIDHADLYINGAFVRSETPAQKGDDHITFLVSRLFETDFTISVTVYGDAKKGTKTLHYYFDNPIFYGTVAEGFDFSIMGHILSMDTCHTGDTPTFGSNNDTLVFCHESVNSLVSIIDMNGIWVNDNFTRHDTVLEVAGSFLPYTCWQSNRCTVQNWPLTITLDVPRVLG